MVTQRDLQEALDKQNVLLTATFESIQNNLISEIALLKQEVLDSRKEASEVRVIPQSNAGEIVRLSSTIKTLVVQNKIQAKEILRLSKESKTRRIASLRNTLVFKGIPKKAGEKSWNDTTDVLIKTVAHDLNLKPEKVSNIFERVHRGRDRENGPPHIFAKVFNWNNSEHLKSDFRGLNIKKRSTIKCDQKYGPRTSNRRNQALVCRRNLLDNKQIVQGFLKFPAKLMVKLEGESKYIVHHDYSNDELVFDES